MDGVYLAGHQFRHHRYIVYVCGGDFHGVRQPGVPVHANIRLVSKVPGVPFLRGMGLRVPFLLPVFSAGRCED